MEGVGSTYQVTIAGLSRELRIVTIPSGVKIALLNAAGDTELIVRGTRELLKLATPFDIALGPALGGALLAHQVSLEASRPYAVARKVPPVDGPAPLAAIVRSIKASDQEKLYLNERDSEALGGRRVLLVDDVVGTGDTMRAMSELVAAAGGQVVCRLALATEGAQRDDVFSLLHLPVFDQSGFPGPLI